MSMSKTNKPAVPTFRERDHRFTALPVSDVLKICMRDLGIKNVDLQKALDYPMPNVISMMKSGSMHLPEGKAIEVADALQLDRVFFLGKVIAENNPALWDAITTVMGDRLVSASELALVLLIRNTLDGHDVNLAEQPEFLQAITPTLNAIVEHQNALARAALNRNDY